MKKITKILSSAAVALLLGSTAASAGFIAQSKHNLSNAYGQAVNNGEICVFCHTPHAANTDVTVAPLWNKPVPNKDNFAMYGQTIAGNESPGISDVSLICLSCHDGVSAMNSVINGPGGGNWVEEGYIMGGVAGNMDGVRAIGASAGLTNDHPVSIDYVPGAASLVAKDTPLPEAPWGSYNTVGDLLRSGKVECGTCHDPHATAGGIDQAGNAFANPTFLRHTNTGSALCLTCHDK